MVCRVVCGLVEVIAIFWPTTAFISVDLPAFGRPTKQANPALTARRPALARAFVDLGEIVAPASDLGVTSH
jgi:hypothetical protein